jgi:cyclic-di-GMP phosphodiesterase TipF (flagellum assembly factor)
MRVVGAILLALCMLIIAGLAGAAVYLYLDLGMLEAATVAIAILALLGLYHTVSSRFGLRSAVSRQLADLSRGGADIGRQVAEMGRRLAALEGKFETVLDQTRAVADPLNVQMSELDARVRRLAETVGVHQATLDAMARSASEQPAVAGSVPPPPPRDSWRDIGAKPSVAVMNEVSLEAIRSAINANRIDLYLQPIVTLPRRKVGFYEAMSRLRSETGETVHESEFVPQAERGGLMPKLDYLVVFRCVQIVRRLLMKNREIGLFCNLSRTTLIHPDVWQQLHDFMAANRAIAPSLILQFAQSAVREMAEPEYERLAALSELGFRFCFNEVTSLRLEPGEIAPRGFRFVKVHAALLLGRVAPARSEAGPGELSELLGRFGIDLIVDRIDNENSVMELLDHDVRYGQGPLFSAPRPVRAEALQTVPNMPDAGVEGLSGLAHRAGPGNGTPPSVEAQVVETEGAEPSRHDEVRGAL